MAIVLTAGTSVESTGSVTSSSVALPAMIAGDAVLLVVSLNASAGTIDTPTGWSTILGSTDSLNGSTSDHLAVFYDVYTPGDPTSVTVTNTSGRVAITPIRVRGGNTGSLPDVVGSIVQLADGATTLTAPAITPTSTCVLWILNGRSPTAGNFLTPFSTVSATEVAEASGKSTTQTNAGHVIIANVAATAGSSSGTASADPANATSGAMAFTFSLEAAGATNAVTLTETVHGSDGLTVVPSGSPTISYKVEIGFASQPDAAVQTWTDISQYVDMAKGISITRGRNDQFSDIPPGQMNFTVNNSDGRFTPEYTGGAYYPNVILGKRVRVTATYLQTSTIRFDGRIDTWPVEFSTLGRYAEVTIHASDRMKKLSQLTPLTNLYSTEVLKDSPTAYFMLADNMTSVVDNVNIKNSSPYSNKQPAITRQVGLAGQGTLTFGATYPGPYVDGGLTGASWRQANNPPDGLVATLTDKARLSDSDGSFSLECWFWSNSTVPNCDGVLVSIGSFYRNGWFFCIQQNTGELGVGWANTTQGYVYNNVPAGSHVVNDSTTHHVVMTYDGPVDRLKLYLDGDLIADWPTVSNDFFGAKPPHSSQYTFRMGGMEFSRTLPGLLVASMSHAASYDNVLTQAQVTNHYVAGTTGWAGDRTDERLIRILGYGGIPSSEIIVKEPGTSTMTWQDPTSATYSNLINVIADTEQGVIFADRATSSFVFQGRSHRWNPPNVITLTSDQYESDLQPVLDDSLMVNSVTVTRTTDGYASLYTNFSSTAANGYYSATLDAAPQYSNDLWNLAAWRVNVQRTAKVRWPTVSVDLRTIESSTWNTLLSLDIGDQFTISGLPAQAPASSIPLFVEGYTETINLTTHLITFNSSKAVTDIWKIGDPVYGKIDSTHLLAY